MNFVPQIKLIAIFMILFLFSMVVFVFIDFAGKAKKKKIFSWVVIACVLSHKSKTIRIIYSFGIYLISFGFLKSCCHQTVLSIESTTERFAMPFNMRFKIPMGKVENYQNTH